MIEKIEDFFFNKVAGKVAATMAKGAAAYLLAHAGILNQWGITTSIDPNALALSFLGASKWAWEAFKKWRQGQKAPPEVITALSAVLDAPGALEKPSPAPGGVKDVAGALEKAVAELGTTVESLAPKPGDEAGK